MIKIFFGVVLAAASAAANSAAWVTCGSAAPGVTRNGQAPLLHISYSPGSDVGTPGLFWLGVLTPDQKSGAVLTPQGWVNYNGGLYPFQSRYDGGLPAQITLSMPFPGGALHTNAYAGYTLYTGHGAYTSKAQTTVASRRQALNGMKAQRVQAGTWRAEYDSDAQFIAAAVQQDMVDNGKYTAAITIPAVDCSPPPPPPPPPPASGPGTSPPGTPTTPTTRAGIQALIAQLTPVWNAAGAAASAAYDVTFNCIQIKGPLKDGHCQAEYADFIAKRDISIPLYNEIERLKGILATMP